MAYRQTAPRRGSFLTAILLLTGNLEELCTHFYDLYTGRDFLRLLLEYTGTFCDGVGNGRSSVWAQANESAKLNGVDGAAVEMVECQQQILDVLGQAVLGRHCLELEDKERLGRHGVSRPLELVERVCC